jgi:3-oxoadipate enol-lactonase
MIKPRGKDVIEMMKRYRTFGLALLISGICLLTVFAQQGAETGGGYLDGGGAKIYYETRGSGPALVLVHDGLLHREVWKEQWETYAKNYRVIRHDRRGYGRSEAAKQPYSEIEDLHALLSHLRVSRAAFIGSPAGSGLVMEYALAHPEAIERLILVGPVVGGLSFSDHFNNRNRENFRPLAERNDMAGTIASWARDPYIIAGNNEAARRRMQELLTQNPQNIAHPYNFTKSPPRPTLVRLGEISAPTLIIVGEADIPDVHAHAGAIQAGIPKAKRMVLSGTGHLPYLERPDAFNAPVLRFLAERN